MLTQALNQYSLPFVKIKVTVVSSKITVCKSQYLYVLTIDN